MRLDLTGYAEVLEIMKSLKKSKLSDTVRGCYCIPYTANPRFWGREVFKQIRQGLDQASGCRVCGHMLCGVWAASGKHK